MSEIKKFWPKLFFGCIDTFLNYVRVGIIVTRMADLFVALENIRSVHNVGAILRTCSFFGVKKVFLIGYSGKEKLPNGVSELSPKLNKTALGSQLDIELVLVDTSIDFLDLCRVQKITVLATEQCTFSRDVFTYVPTTTSVLVFGNEVDGVSELVICHAKHVLEIPCRGTHNSLNVSVSCGVALGVLTRNMLY